MSEQTDTDDDAALQGQPLLGFQKLLLETGASAERYYFVILYHFVSYFLGLISVLYHLRSPILEETQHLLLIVALSFLQETRILNMDDISLLVKYDKHRKS